MTTTPRLRLPLMASAQSQKHVTHNAALILLDAMTHCAVSAIGTNAPPQSASSGECHVVGSAPTGAFASAAGEFAIYDGYAWQFVPVRRGNLVFNLSDSRFWFFESSGWRPMSDLFAAPASLEQLGIGTAPDAVNRFAVKLNASLFTARPTSESGSGDLRMSLNKQGASHTVSQIYQSNFSARAETGLAGDDNFRLKLSSDGVNWRDALIGYVASGAVRIDQLLLARANAANRGRIECDFSAPNSVGTVLTDTSSTANAAAIVFRKANVQVGAVQLTATGTSYSTTSDHRLKIKKGPITGAVERVMALKPIRFAFTSEPENERDGFFAHEVAKVVPDAVTGEENAVDALGKPVLQGLDTARLVPLLVAALQEIAGRVADIERDLPRNR